MAHTKGPWNFRTDRLSGDNGITADGTGVFIECFAEIRHAGEGARDEALANARLVAAAPDLLAALKDCAEGSGFQYMTFEARERVSDAIAKAEGRS